MAVQGIFMSNQGIVGERQGDFASAILMTQPNGTAPFLALSAGMKKESTQDTVFTWFEDVHISGRTRATAGGTGTTITVDDGSFYVPNSIVMNENTGEHMLVTASTDTTITVIRGLSATTVVAITSGDHLQKLGNAFEEASGMPTPVTQQGKPLMNYTQIFRNGWAISGTAKAVKYLTGNKVAHNKKMCAAYHAEDMERAFLWGKKTITTLNNKQFRLTDGALTQIELNGGVVKTAATGGVAGDLSRGDLETFIEEIFRYNVMGESNERFAFGGANVLTVWNRMAWIDGSYEVKQGETKLGMKVTEVECVHGSLKLLTHPLMNENPVWRNELYAFHPGGVKKRVLRESFHEDYDKNGNRINGRDADEGVITTEAGIQIGAPRTMGIYRNIKKAVATT